MHPQQETINIPGFGTIPITRVELREIGGSPIQLRHNIRGSVMVGPYVGQELVIHGVEGAASAFSRKSRVFVSKRNGGGEKPEILFLLSAFSASDDLHDELCEKLSCMLAEPRRKTKK